MLRNIFLYALIIIGTALWAQKPVLKFNDDKKFKIVQFTDLHYISADSRSNAALKNIEETLDAENPDLVIFTGDIIYGKPAKKNLRDVLRPVSKRKIPFVITFGNHDDEYDLSRSQLFEIIQSYRYNLTEDTPGLSGVGNCIIKIQPADNGVMPAAVLYCFDSNSYSGIQNIKGYDYIKFDQIAWYRSNSQKLTALNNGIPLFSLAFFHIPLPEYNLAVSAEQTVISGTRKEKECAPQLNSGLFASIKEMNDIKGIFAGHDHDNDYAVCWNDILLSYGRYSGGNTVYNNLKPNGARVIVLTEGEDSFRTYIRLLGGEIINDVVFPDFFEAGAD